MPILDLGNRKGATGYIDFLSPKELNYPLMKGVDCHQRPFIACKLLNTRGESFVVTLFQRYTDSDAWTWGGNSAPSGFAPNAARLVSNETFDYFRQILNRSHPEYRLAD
ncbi:MAG: hypothetical protein HWD61_08810 [Parachlamydiaceae bacterium]|nr:MAG: hypothetical protein HWD61_08810 [Parachlamydiaceae bacterium]